MSKQRVSRRQFLNYTLTGVGGFMAAGMLMPMVRFAVDPVLKAEASGDFKATKQKVSELSNEPVRVDFSYEQKDAWYTSDVTQTAWVYKNKEGKIIALSPICKHLGCTVNWNASEDHKEMFYCPCHGGLYHKNGENVPGTPPTAPLDSYPTKEKDGILYLGQPEPNKFVKK
ncbi:ubiquinol-cytochrome c reductase iron-sulfur subunit [Rossellomorea marisflavi]|jgi:menaquinol-cytochrome c reductase iron-sulfur subunit|uniref:Menaquinol:cytochrome c reductase iron-sulfur subunit n=1 Tax=Rossellomorea marisflavi TaxID=189381 RepID=A0A0M0GP69_9BACI|nr:ubiquinol-cytochrome c reductase iron-sulfur subunit [Rossellomorea marisflavi]KQU59793.1 menaquinol-cytochrome C reductase [Bacillus sp. Leaf406]MBV6683592.1 ubiquinol-cytochrome c reductase iron-sulfur subunit [Bacillus sp. JRC01]VXB32162.1 menaquinol:cytochrome c oxidoreductase (iron-sulfur subunit) [Bacillus sp. 349Y]KON91558.1 menaquinol-cytochrome C reductase [Rossellomorea marisflavi]MCM2590667.1 ubiquinol-cytochrome c reductase iron-sulfur subunit [Rossellomorea marisflavi]